MPITKLTDGTYKVEKTGSVAELKRKIESLTADLKRQEENYLAAHNAIDDIENEISDLREELEACAKAGMKDAVDATAAIEALTE